MRILSLRTQALHREDEGAGRVIGCKRTALKARLECQHNYCSIATFVLLYCIIIKSVGCKGKFNGRGFRGVRYIEAILRGKSPFGSIVLSAVQNREVSASRRLTMYYSGSDFNLCHGLCPL